MSTSPSRFDALKTIWVKFFSFVLFAAVSINFLEIILRTLFNYSIDLFYDLPTWLTTWSMLLVSGVILLDNEHLCIDAIHDKLTGTSLKVLDTINNILTILFGITITYSGCIFIAQLYSFNTTFNRIIPVPRWLVELCVPLGMGLFTICAIIKLICDLKKKYNEIEEQIETQ